MPSLASGSQQEARAQYCLCLWVVDQERNLAVVHVCSSVHSEELEGVVEMVGLRAGLLPRKMGELHLHSH